MSFVCGVCYRPPNYNSAENNALLDHLQFCLDEINQIPGTFVLLFGDFNANFDMENVLPSSDFGSCLYRWMACNSLFQVINEPTRITEHSATLLDLIFTNSPGYFVKSGTLSPPGDCDHSLVHAHMSISFAKPKSYMRHVWDYSRIDYNKLSEALCSDNWEVIFNCVEDVDVLYNRWFESFRQILEMCVPNGMVVIRPMDNPWMNSKIRKAIRKRNRLLKFYCRRKNSTTWENYRLQRNLTTTLIRICKTKYFANLNMKLQDPKLGPKKWWGIVKSLYGSKIQSTIPALFDGDRVITDAKEKATLFNLLYYSM